MALVATGVALGSGAAIGAYRLIANQMYGVGIGDRSTVARGSGNCLYRGPDRQRLAGLARNARQSRRSAENRVAAAPEPPDWFRAVPASSPPLLRREGSSSFHLYRP